MGLAKEAASACAAATGSWAKRLACRNRGGGVAGAGFADGAAGFVLVSDAVEVAFALGPVLWASGVGLALPLLLGCVRHVISFRRLVVLHVLACLTLVCGLGPTMLLWVFAIVVAAVSPAQSPQFDAAPYGGSAMPPGRSEVWEGPPSVG